MKMRVHTPHSFHNLRTDTSSHAAQGASRMPEDRQRSPGVVFDSSDRDFTSRSRRHGSAETTPRAKKSQLAYEDDISLFDAPTHSGRQAPVVRRKIPPPARPQTQNKIMTPAQFEQYRKQQEMTSTAHPRDKQDSDDDEEDDDDDEIERSKQAARQRRKQEAHMSVYRQQMMKVTGEQPSDLPDMQLRPAMERSSASAPALASSMVPEFSFDKPSENGAASDDEEDEDVPLGVLAAHGFPFKGQATISREQCWVKNTIQERVISSSTTGFSERSSRQSSQRSSRVCAKSTTRSLLWRRPCKSYQPRVSSPWTRSTSICTRRLSDGVSFSCAWTTRGSSRCHQRRRACKSCQKR